VALHWLTAAAFAFQIGLGWRMDGPRGPETFAVFQLHKSVGITILLLTLVRIAWRLTHRPPPYPATLRPLDVALARTVHAAFYLLLLGLPLSGWLIVSSSKVAVPTFLYGTIPWPHVPGVATLSAAHKATVNDLAARTHVVLVWSALAAILLHVAGALKHQLFERGDYLARMTLLPRRLLTAAGLLIILAFVGLFALGRSVHLAPIAIARGEPAPAPLPIVPRAPAASPLPTPESKPAPAPASAPPTQPAVDQAVASEPSLWTVRKAESSLRFHTAWSQGPVDGGFGSWRAEIRFDPAALARSAVHVTIDMASVTAADSDQQSALPENDWFAVATHPTATWSSTAIRHLGGDRYRADGTLSLRGVSRPLPLSFTLRIEKDVATMHGTASIDRTAFGVGQGEWASTADLPALVSLNIEIKADRAPATSSREKRP
jgi:cytochrome b561/polyisoprenoid-binding protein YceI